MVGPQPRREDALLRCVFLVLTDRATPRNGHKRYNPKRINITGDIQEPTVPRRKLLFFQVFAAVALLAAFVYVQGGGAAQTRQVEAPFRDYYDSHQGIRVLGYPLSGMMEIEGVPVQYFEKGRIEDHRTYIPDPRWAFA